MTLDPVAQRYAHAIFVDRQEELSRAYVTRLAEVRGDLARRGLLPHTAGHYHSEMALLGIEHIGEVATAKLDSLLEAYAHSNLPIDDQAVQDINREVLELIEAQEKNQTTNIVRQADLAKMPSGVADQMAATIAARVSGIKARVLRRLNTKRDEGIMAARAAPKPEAAALRDVSPDTKNWSIQIWHKSSKWQWYTGFFAAASFMVTVQEYFICGLLLMLSTLSLLSKLAHWRGRASLKCLGGLGILFAAGLLLYIVVAIKGPSPWSHLQAPLVNITSGAKKPLPAPLPVVAPAPTLAPSKPAAAPLEPIATPKRNPDQLANPRLKENAAPTKDNSHAAPAPTGQAVAPNGIANAAPNFGSQTVNNFGPPPRPPAVIHVCVSGAQPVDDSTSGELRQILTLTTDSEVNGPTYVFEFSGPIIRQTAASSPDMAMNIGEKLTSSTGFGFRLFQTWFPGQRINVDVHSLTPVKLVSQSGNFGEIFVFQNGGCVSGL